MTAKVDYTVRAAIELADAGRDNPIKGEQIAREQRIPMKYLENILGELKRSGLVGSQRGADGGYWLARPADQITVAELIRAVEGPLANVRGMRPEDVEFAGRAVPLQRMWVCVRASLRSVLEVVTVADLVAGKLPPEVDALAEDPEAWEPH
ncbi:MAG TPA: Rrf2 family transcriptional regulator [Acidimicrobiales bacterium]|nr:Rrf2 family transcriptional regulator [Acidimicrobiales bacterium]